ncbi:TSUP family transporter [Falsiroseomonas selenitidurans]|uniref:Probable membrane transporter protein n=1 Tax=Falsiroseomonas selenitidurans TaxID=2716335 RepID=A0ABX1EA73_9PROT|nr:TSUP family transporter [Falsiroseomonas selenitidurans]NKC34089.1 TSUP family transporter [Falsiroseomonas selenitidurans]
MSLFLAYSPTGVLVLLLAGGLIGAIGGLLGIGGGIIAVPVLLEILARPQLAAADATGLAIGTAQAVVVLAAASAAWAHAGAGTIDRGILRAWLPATLLGGLLGLALAPFVPTTVALAAFALLALALAAAVVAGNRVLLAAAPPRGRLGWLVPAAIGLASTLLGVGAGTLSGPVLGLFGVPLPRAVGAGAVFNLVVAAPAVLGYALAGWGRPGLPADALGHVSLVAAALLAVPAMLVAPMAARWATRLSQSVLRAAFAACLLAIALRLAWRIL